MTKNNTLPLGKQICFTIGWDYAEILPSKEFLNTEADVKLAKEQSKTIITSLSLHGQLSIVKQLKLLS